MNNKNELLRYSQEQQFAASGYYGLYKDQTIVYSKYKAKYVNKRTRF